MLMVTIPDWINSPPHLSRNHSHRTICSKWVIMTTFWFVTSSKTPDSVSLRFMMFVIAGIIVYWAVMSAPVLTRCPLLSSHPDDGGGGPGSQSGICQFWAQSHAGWWPICVQCPHWGWHDGLSRRRQLISALHHIPGLVIHQTESCICIINCCSFTVCFPNCPLCPWAVGTHVQLSRNLYKTLYREM